MASPKFRVIRRPGTADVRLHNRTNHDGQANPGLSYRSAKICAYSIPCS